MSDKSAIVIDNGSGYTKLGFAGSSSPLHVIPTTISIETNNNVGSRTDSNKYLIGQESSKPGIQKMYHTRYPIRGGIVEDWNDMERFWAKCIYEKLRVCPSEHYFLITEPTFTSPGYREYMVEIMFETFNVAGVYLAPQAILAIAASWASEDSLTRDLTATVVEIGEGATSIIPVANGHIIGSCIKTIPISGRDVTSKMMRLLRQRKEPLNSAEAFDTCRRLKEKYCYVCPDIEKEKIKYANNPDKYIKLDQGISLAEERFLATEVLFEEGLADKVDQAIQNCPVDTRRSLYSNIVLSGGSTMFPDFEKRLRRDIKRIVEKRYGRGIENKIRSTPAIEINVVSHHIQDISVWFGGSMLASTPNFPTMCITRKQYEQGNHRILNQYVRFS